MINETSQPALSTTPNRLSRSPIIKHEPREDDATAMVKQESNELNDLNPYDTHQRFDPHNKSPSPPPSSGIQAPLLSPLNKLDVSDLVEPSEIEKLLAETKAHAKLSPINSLSDADEQKVDKRRIKREHREHRKSKHEMAIGASSDSEEEGGRSSDATSRRAYNCDERIIGQTTRVPSGHSSAESSGKEKQRARHRPPKKPKGRRQSMVAQEDSDNNNTILTTNNNSSSNNGSRTSNPTVPHQSITATTTTTKGKGIPKPVTPEKGRTKGGRAISSSNSINSNNNNIKKRLVPIEENRDSVVIKSGVSPLSETSSSSSEGDDDEQGMGKARVTARGADEEEDMEVEEGEIEAKTKRKGAKLVNGGGATSNGGSSSSSSSSGDSSNSSSSSSEDDEEEEEESKKDLFGPTKKGTPSQQLLSPKVTMLRKPSGLSDENSNSMSSPNHRRPRHNSLSKTQLSSPAANIKGATPSSVHSDRSTGSGSKRAAAAGRGTPGSNSGSAAATVAAVVAAKKGGGKNKSGSVKTSATVASSDASNDSEVDSEEERRTKSDKKKNDTLRKLFSSHSKGEGGAKGAKGGKGKGQVVIVDHSEEAHVSEIGEQRMKWIIYYSLSISVCLLVSKQK